MREEDNHGGISIGGIGMLHRHEQIRKMVRDVENNGNKSKYHQWYKDYSSALSSINKRKIDRYNRLPNWLKVFFKNPNK